VNHREDQAANSAKGSDQVTSGHPQNPTVVLNISGNMENSILAVQGENSCI